MLNLFKRILVFIAWSHTLIRGENIVEIGGLRKAQLRANYIAKPLATNAAVTITSQVGLVGQGFSVTTPQSQMLWLIQPSTPSSQKIQFIFQALNINSAQLQVYDSSEAQSGNLLFNCVGCGNLIPPPFFSTTGAVYVSVAGFAGSPFQSSTFSIQFVSQPTSKTVQLNNITINMNAGYGKLYPQQFNSITPANSVQQWIISTLASSPITFSLSNFQFDSSCVSTLKIYDDVSSITGNLIFSGCKSADASRPWFYSNTGKALVVFSSGGRDSSNVFLLTYIAYTELYNCGSFLQPDNLGDDSMVLTDGSAKPNFMRRGQQCTWLISPKNFGTVTLVLRWVSLKSGSSVVVYDGSSSSSAILWNGVGPTYITPPLLTSSGSSMYVVFTCNTLISNGYYGFRGEYLTNYYGSTGVGSGVSLLSMSSALDIMPPGDAVFCTPGITYTWNIVPSQVSGPLTLVVTSLNLSATSQLTVYDGSSTAAPVLAKYSGSKTPFQWLKTSTAVATMQFTSSASSGGKQGNFKVSYYGDGNSYNCGFPSSRVASVTAYSSSITDGTTSTSSALPNQQCSWNISPPKASAVYLFFSYFSLSGGTLQIFSGPVSSGQLIATISGSAVPSPMLIAAGTVGITYTTGTQVSGYGFSASYFGVSSSYFYGPGNGIIQLRSSAVSGLSLTAKTSTGLILSPKSNSNFTWIINPSNAQGSIFIAFSRLNLSNNAILEVYDGLNMSSPLLASYTGSALQAPYQWLQTRSTAAVLSIVSPRSRPLTKADFSLSYYANGNNFQCGYGLGPESTGGVTTLTAPSMIITDGSAIANVMLASQSCQWRISRPANATFIALEFMASDLRGGQLAVYDGPNANSPLLWRCSSCSVVPRTLISYSSAVYLAFSTSLLPIGTGFQAVYWTSSSSRSSGIFNPANGTFLDLPAGYQLDAIKNNTSTLWKLNSVAASARLTFYPRVAMQPVSTVPGVSDGRPSPKVFPAPQTRGFTCGTVVGPARYALSGSDVYQVASQYASSYVVSSPVSTQMKTLHSMQGAWDTSVPQSSTAMFQPAKLCKYELDSGSTQSVIINVKKFASANFARLRIFGGIYGFDAVLYDSLANQNALPQSAVVAPCGKALIILDYNTTLSPGLATVNFGFDLSFKSDPTDTGNVCIAYILSLQPHAKKTNPWIKVYIGCGVAAFVVLTVIVLYCYRRHLPDMNCKWTSRPAYQSVTPNYPRYSPKLDEFRNKFLPTGECCVCQEPQKVIRLSCHHGICIDDIKGYLESALGNIALFPVKCPMHYEACEGGIDAQIAKRVLSRTQYDRFIEFSDRALYGEGMRCIFCNNFVNYPESSSQSMVECPYCVQRFCIRCKKPWHYGARCPLDNVDDSLEAWKMDSGAQKCPACHKLIEKDDPDTCNHMVHKITDGIPCVRDRTDFCYCCGEEVAPDYPHDEIQNPGVNHFPDGVFQKCRFIVKKEQDAERERLKRLRRMKNKPKASPKKSQVASMDGWDSDYDGTAHNPVAGGEGVGGIRPLAVLAATGDRFDDQWNQMLGSPTASVTSVATPTVGRLGTATVGAGAGNGGGGGGGGNGNRGNAVGSQAVGSPVVAAASRRGQGQAAGQQAQQAPASPSGRAAGGRTVGRGARAQGQGAARST